MWNKTGIIVLLLVTAAHAKPSEEGYSPLEELPAKAYANLHPNAELGENPEYGEYFEGDILGRDKDDPRDEINPLNAITNRSRLWPNGTMYYKIVRAGYTSDEISKIKTGIADLVNLTKVKGRPCIQILPWQKEPHYVYVGNFSGCNSHVGRYSLEGPQKMSLASGCVKRHGTIMHEFLHAFGFGHEHTRFDRDKYITVKWRNIQREHRHNFKKKAPPKYGLLGTRYDYGSVMHYERDAFPIDDSLPTIIPLDPNAKIGQRKTLSPKDIQRVQIHYGCLKPADSRFFKNLDPRWIPQMPDY